MIPYPLPSPPLPSPPLPSPFPPLQVESQKQLCLELHRLLSQERRLRNNDGSCPAQFTLPLAPPLTPPFIDKTVASDSGGIGTAMPGDRTRADGSDTRVRVRNLYMILDRHIFKSSVFMKFCSFMGFPQHVFSWVYTRSVFTEISLSGNMSCSFSLRFHGKCSTFRAIRKISSLTRNKITGLFSWVSAHEHSMTQFIMKIFMYWWDFHGNFHGFFMEVSTVVHVVFALGPDYILQKKTTTT